jgi:hypothetical protein
VSRHLTGFDAEARSSVLIDAKVARMTAAGTAIWSRASVPADNSARANLASSLCHGEDARQWHDIRARRNRPLARADRHAISPLDDVAMVKREIAIEREVREVRVGAGKFLVDGGLLHAWRNDGPDLAIGALVTGPARPIGEGNIK